MVHAVSTCDRLDAAAVSGATDETKTAAKIGGWLASRDHLQMIGVMLGLLITVTTVVGGIASFGAKLAEHDFVTVSAAKEREAELLRQMETRIETSEALAAQRESALVARIETLRKSQEESNARMQVSIDRIYNLLLRGR